MQQVIALEKFIEGLGDAETVDLPQILHAFPQVQSDPSLLPDILKELENEGIGFENQSNSDSDLDDDVLEDILLAFDNDEADAGSGAVKKTRSSGVANSLDVPINDFVGQYMLDMNQHPLLTAEEEVALSKSIEAGKFALERLQDENLTPAERDCFQLAVERADQARNTLIQANTRLVISIAKRYYGQGLDFLDLIQEGNIGLLTAVDKYNYRLGNRFSTYATWWIRQGITRALVNYGRMIRIPAHQATNVRKLYRVTRDWEQEHGRIPTPEEIAAETGLTPHRVRWLQQITRPLLALEQPAGDEKDSELGDFIEDEDAQRPAEVVANKMFREKISEILDTLSPREASVLRLRYGLQGNEPHTLKEVGKKFNLSRERIRQVEKGALRKLRHIKFGGEMPYFMY